MIGIPLRTHGSETDDLAVLSSARLYADLAKTGDVKRLWMCADVEAADPPQGFKSVGKACLSDCTELDTVVLASHGNEGQMGYWPDANAFASQLRWGGLGIVNELRLAACLVGKKDYVGNLKQAYTMDGIAVKKFVAFSESVGTVSSWGHKAVEVAGLFDWLMGNELYRVEVEGNI